MRLGFVGNSSLASDGHEYWYRSGEWRYLERVAPLFKTVDIVASVEEQILDRGRHERKHVSRLNVPNATVYTPRDHSPLEGANSTWVGKRLGTLAALRRLSKMWDFAFIVMPGWPALFSWWFYRYHKWPYALSARADWVPVIEARSSRRPQWVNCLLGPYVRIARRVQYQLLRHATIRMVSGNLLLNRYPEFRGSTLTTLNTELALDQFRWRPDTCNRDKIRLVYVGSLIKRKSVHLAIQALSRLEAEGWDLRFDIIGDGPQRERLETTAKGLSVQERVKFHGYISDKERILDELFHSDVFVITSASEGFPRVIYEAMSQSLPVVATDVGGISGFVEHEVTALLVDRGDIQGIVAAIRRILGDRGLRKSLIRNGYAFAHDFVQSDPVAQAVDAFRTEIGSLRESQRS